jgi:hypothetical protein
MTGKKCDRLCVNEHMWAYDGHSTILKAYTKQAQVSFKGKYLKTISQKQARINNYMTLD